MAPSGFVSKALLLIEHTFVARESIKKAASDMSSCREALREPQPWHEDYSRLDGNFCARDMDPLIKQWEAACLQCQARSASNSPTKCGARHLVVKAECAMCGVILATILVHVAPEINESRQP